MNVLRLASASSATFIRKLRESNSIKAKAARGTLWLGAGSGAEQGLRFVRQVILTRLLVPQAFGAMAIVLAVSGIFDAMTEVGIKQAVIQNPKGQEKTFLNGAWWFSSLRGIGLYLVGFIAMPYIASFYQDKDVQNLTPMLRVAFLAIVLNAMMSVQAYVVQKTMDYGRWVILYHGGGIIGVVITILLGFKVRDEWALVIGFVSESAARTILSFIVCPFMPGFKFDKEQLRDLFLYAQGMVGLPVLTFMYNKADVFVVGKLLSKSDLGLYIVAYGLAQTPNLLYGTILVPILMPAFSAMQDDHKVLASNLIRSTKYVALAVLPAFTLLACAAPQVLRLLYGKQYVPVSFTFAILCATVAVRVVCRGLVMVYYSTGRPNLSRQALIVRLVSMAVLIVPLTKYFGLAGAAFAGLISSIAGEAFNLFKLKRIISLSVPTFFRELWTSAASSIAIVAVWLIIVFVI